MTTKYAIGIDYGTESGRILIADVQSGEEIAVSVVSYAHGVMTTSLPSGIKLGLDWALQHPNDYLDVLYQGIPKVLKETGISARDIIGIGIDFTSCTVLPVDDSLTPLCLNSRWADHPHSWVKLWKHHAAQPEANELTKLAEDQKEAFLLRYGGKISSEWLVPKLMQIASEDAEVFAETKLFLEAGDWVTYHLTHSLVRSSGAAGFKALWHKQSGYPDQSFFTALHPGFTDILTTKMKGQVVSLGSKAGELKEDIANRLGLMPGTAVAVGAIDAHAAVPAVGAVKAGQLVMAMGTSTCHMFLANTEKSIEGVCGVVEDGLIPGFFGYEAGQVAVGDIFAWYVDNYISDHIKALAEESNLSLHEWLEQKAALSKPGQSGLLALDWWNGNRSVLVNADLSGLLIGLTLSTRPEEIYRALLEATAFGTKRIIESFTKAGLEVTEIFACGGLPQKNKLLMQIYADVTGREIKIADSTQTAALGSAMFGAVAASAKHGGYDTIFAAAQKMAKIKTESYQPIPENAAVYQKLYAEYKALHDYFGKGQNDVMHTLKTLRSTY